MWDSVDLTAFKHYGIWLVIGAVLGAILQNEVPQNPLLVIIGLFLIILPMLTISEKWTGYRIPEANDRIGGFGSGFMGGLSGHQGASACNVPYSQTTRQNGLHAATASILALCVDLSRIPVYLIFRPEELLAHSQITLVLVVSAIIGVRVGKRWLKALKSTWIHNGVMIGIVASGIFYIWEGIA